MFLGTKRMLVLQMGVIRRMSRSQNSTNRKLIKCNNKVPQYDIIMVFSTMNRNR